MFPLHLELGGVPAPLEWRDAFLAAGLLVVASAVPFALGLRGLSRLRLAPGVAAGLSSGIVLFLLVDLLREAALGAAVLRPAFTLALLAAFVAGIVLPAWLLPRLRGPAPGGATWPAALWAAGVGAHAAGEGFVVGTEAHAALLGLPFWGAMSFVLHKALEGASVRPFSDEAPAGRAILRLTLVAALPAAAGALVGALLGPSRLGPVLFALGGGAAAWATLSLARRGDGRPGMFVAAAVGALLVYGAGLLHEL